MERFEYQEMMEIGMEIEVEEEFHAVMENLTVKSENTKTVDLQPPILSKEVEEEFHAVMENVKSEERKTIDLQPPILSKEVEEESHAMMTNLKSGETNTVNTVDTVDTVAQVYLPLLSHCRLCAMPDYNMVDIFGNNATSKNILSQINFCLPVVVKDTDILPKRICWSCSRELDRCHRFHKTVAKAEQQLLAFARVAFDNLEEMGTDSVTIPRYNRANGSTEHDKTFETISKTEISNDTSTSRQKRAPAVDTTVKRNVSSSSMIPCSVVLSIAEIECKENSEANSKEKSLRDSKRQNSYSTAGVLNLGTTPASGIIPRSTCDSGSTKETRSGSVADATQGKEVEHVSTKRVDPPIHERSHTQERSHRCTTCAKMYKSKYSLAQHNKVHTGKGIYICQYCGKKSISENDMIRHRRIHTGERLFNCSICEKRFARSDNLKVHITRVHSYRRGYPCSVCDKTFKILHDKTKHMSVHRDKNQTALYQCDYCKKSHTRKRYLVTHIKSCKRR